MSPSPSLPGPSPSLPGLSRSGAPHAPISFLLPIAPRPQIGTTPPPPIWPPFLHSHPAYPRALPAPRACASTDGSAAHIATWRVLRQHNTCDNSYFDAVHWKNGSIIGAPVMRAHEQFIFVKVSLAVGVLRWDCSGTSPRRVSVGLHVTCVVKRLCT